MATPKENALPGIKTINKHLALLDRSKVSKDRLEGLHASGIFATVLSCPDPSLVDMDELRKVLHAPPPSNFELGNSFNFRMDYDLSLNGLLSGYNASMTILIKRTLDSVESHGNSPVRIISATLARLQKELPINAAEKELQELGVRLLSPKELLTLLRCKEAGALSKMTNIKVATIKNPNRISFFLSESLKHVQSFIGDNLTLPCGDHFVIDLD